MDTNGLASRKTPQTLWPSLATSSRRSARSRDGAFAWCGPASCRRLAAGAEPAWKGVWKDRSRRSWYVEACRGHAPKVTSGPAEIF